jgi:hypothetical protein
VPKLGAFLTLALCVPLAACGNKPVAVPDLGRTALPGPARSFAGTGGDVSFSYPGNWALISRDPPGVATVASGGASITVWAYRAVSKVGSLQAAAAARARLLASLRRRDPSFTPVRASQYRLLHDPAVEIDGMTEIGGRKLGVRSVHIYRGGAEYVVDMLADPAVFSAANSEVMQPLLVSLRINGRPPVPNGAPQHGAPPSPAATPTGRR